MDFLGIGPWEILLILVLLLIVFGPGKLPEMSRSLGRVMRALKKATSDLSTQVAREIEAGEEHHPGQGEKRNRAEPMQR